MMKVLVVDDERLARRGITVRLKDRPEFQVVGECGSGNEALASLRAVQPDLIFLDVQMPGMSGLDLLDQLGTDRTASVIFLTAFDTYALKAFEHHAIDYLLKPIDDARFDEALERVLRARDLQAQEERCAQLQKLLQAERNSLSNAPLQRFAVRTGHRIAFVDCEDIFWIEASGDYAALHVAAKTFLVREQLSDLANRLNAFLFVRIHRSTIVRIDRIVRLQSLASGDCCVTLTDGTVLRVSRTFSSTLRKSLRAKGQRACCS